MSKKCCGGKCSTTASLDHFDANPPMPENSVENEYLRQSAYLLQLQTKCAETAARIQELAETLGIATPTTLTGSAENGVTVESEKYNPYVD